MDKERLIERISSNEGFRGFAYKDTLGNFTIGYGRKITPDQAEHDYRLGVSSAEAYSMLEDDVNKTIAACQDRFPWFEYLNDIRQEVVVEMAFQLGVYGVSLFQGMIRAIKNNDWALAADEMLNSAWHKQTPSRCESLANLMLNGYNEETT